ncbi:alpha/beta hydrolase [Prauserella oleivorans]|uniref:Alpha/beta hydrolase n=1 Tax=Prauserella oleivorans TaxID=1478153 RepID=A0ABW5W430_9PSEU
MPFPRPRTAGALTTALVALLCSPISAAAEPAPRQCQEVDVPVTINVAMPVHAHGTLCTPAGAQPSTVQVLLHGATYNSTYWDFPVQPERYSYVRAANERGYATFNVDRIGYGGSTKVPSATLTALAQADVAHQIVTKLRNGHIGPTAFRKVVLVGHSVGSGIAAIAASRYRDVDGLVLTGMTHHFSPTQVAQALLRDLHPVTLDETFRSKADPGYLTTKPGGRERLFYAPGDADPAVIAAEEKTKDIASVTEIADAYAIGFTTPITRAVDVPVLVAVGSHDAIFCQGLLSSPCHDSATLRAGERLYFSPDTPLEATVIHGSGHDIALSESHSRRAHATLLDWADRSVGT